MAFRLVIVKMRATICATRLALDSFRILYPVLLEGAQTMIHVAAADAALAILSLSRGACTALRPPADALARSRPIKVFRRTSLIQFLRMYSMIPNFCTSLAAIIVDVLPSIAMWESTAPTICVLPESSWISTSDIVLPQAMRSVESA